MEYWVTSFGRPGPAYRAIFGRSQNTLDVICTGANFVCEQPRPTRSVPILHSPQVPYTVVASLVELFRSGAHGSSSCSGTGSQSASRAT